MSHPFARARDGCRHSRGPAATHALADPRCSCSILLHQAVPSAHNPPPPPPLLSSYRWALVLVEAVAGDALAARKCIGGSNGPYFMQGCLAGRLQGDDVAAHRRAAWGATPGRGMEWSPGREAMRRPFPGQGAGRTRSRLQFLRGGRCVLEIIPQPIRRCSGFKFELCKRLDCASGNLSSTVAGAIEHAMIVVAGAIEHVMIVANKYPQIFMRSSSL